MTKPRPRVSRQRPGVRWPSSAFRDAHDPSKAPEGWSTPKRCRACPAAIFPAKRATWHVYFNEKGAPEGAGIAIQAAKSALKIEKRCNPGDKARHLCRKDCNRRDWDCTRSGNDCTRSREAVQSRRQRLDSKRLRMHSKRQGLHPKSVIFDKIGQKMRFNLHVGWRRD